MTLFSHSFSFSRWIGILLKEFIQLERVRLTFGMIVGIPIMQPGNQAKRSVDCSYFEA